MYLKIAIVCLCFLLNACGFQPLYGHDRTVLDQTSAVQIQPIAGEGGYQMELILQNRLNPHAFQNTQKYRLTVTLSQPKYVNQSIRNDNFASLESMSIKASYQLSDIQSGAILIQSQVDSNGLFNLIDDPYATVMGQNKLYDNLIQLMADDIATHVLSYFKGKTE